MEITANTHIDMTSVRFKSVAQDTNIVTKCEGSHQESKETFLRP